ncbi:hypothetical protein B0T22DRAFT_80256 [Podospora appendiculata]|uniref:Secreted protein n=1 Tax=Podospora appendiculata TaxID=314037 RepID=A0AAE0XK45_9PEZI|nr:hypothetical protein B0T22DRAFT_80256 [Podospora appendiculata]
MRASFLRGLHLALCLDIIPGCSLRSHGDPTCQPQLWRITFDSVHQAFLPSFLERTLDAAFNWTSHFMDSVPARACLSIAPDGAALSLPQKC